MAIAQKLPVCIHGGMPKTGTTTLQAEVFKHLDGLASIGKKIPQSTRGRAWKRCLRSLCSEPSWGKAEQENAATALNEMVADMPEGYWSDRSSIVLSFEGLFNTKGFLDPIERPSRLIGVLRSAGFEADLHYLLTTREPISFLESEYRNHFGAARRIPSLAEWIEGRYERWDPFDYPQLKDSLSAIDDISSVTFVPMEDLFQCKAWCLDAMSDALSLDGRSREQLEKLLSEAPRLKERPDELRFLCGRLRFELSEHRIPLGWAVSMVEFAATKATQTGAFGPPARSAGRKMKKLPTIWKSLSQYGSDGLGDRSNRSRPADPDASRPSGHSSQPGTDELDQGSR